VHATYNQYYWAGINGFFFDVEANRDIIVTGIRMNIINGGTFSLFQRIGSGNGFTTSSVGWAQVGSATASSSNTEHEVPIGGGGIPIGAGQKHAFHAFNTGGIKAVQSSGNPTWQPYDGNADLMVMHNWAVPNLWSGSYYGQYNADKIQIIYTISDGCVADADCDDGLFCNGAETCNNGSCETGTPPTCDDGSACTIDSCENNACVHTTCPGQLCDTVSDTCVDCLASTDCTDGNECEDALCTGGMTCSYTLNDANCPSGFYCDPSGCVDTNECLVNNGGCSQICTNQVGAPSVCSCNSGYELAADDTTCTDINECTLGTNNCDVNAQCTNTPGSFTCACNAGYEGDGTTCTETDECASGTHNCDVNAQCTNTPDPSRVRVILDSKEMARRAPTSTSVLSGPITVTQMRSVPTLLAPSCARAILDSKEMASRATKSTSAQRELTTVTQMRSVPTLLAPSLVRAILDLKEMARRAPTSTSAQRELTTVTQMPSVPTLLAPSCVRAILDLKETAPRVPTSTSVLSELITVTRMRSVPTLLAPSLVRAIPDMLETVSLALQA